MRGIGRWIFNRLTGLSLLLCVGTCLVWVRSHRGGINYHWGIEADNRPHGTVFWSDRYFIAEHGELIAESTYRVWDSVGADIRSVAPSPGPGSNHGPWSAEPTAMMGEGAIDPTLTDSWRLGGFRLFLPAGEPRALQRYHYDERIYSITAPLWALFAIFALLPACWVIGGVRRRARRGGGFCSSCSYDLTGNVSGVCPECGMKIAEAR